MAFTEFYCDPVNGSNLNGGSDTGAPSYTATNGGWNSGTGVFTPASGNPSLSVTVGQFASVYLDGAAAPTGFVGRVTAVDTATVTISLTAASGTPPDTGSPTTIKVGGAWKGPNGADGFPFAFITNVLKDAAGDIPRVNFLGTFNITAAISHANAGPYQIEGYTAVPGDGGRATIDGGTTGASYVLLNLSGAAVAVKNLVLQNNGATGQANGLNVNGGACYVEGVVVHNVRGTGLAVISGDTPQFVECEAYACNLANVGTLAGFTSGGTAYWDRCVAHDNAGANNVGWYASSRPVLTNCIADTNGSHGIHLANGAVGGRVSGCDLYGNGGDGVRLDNSAATTYLVENCNLVKNGGYGVRGFSASGRVGKVSNCGFGSGTQVNTSGTTNGLSSMVESGSVTYAADVTPWVDPANGDFRITLAAAKGAGRGTFTQTASGYAGTIAYPDIGAAQHQVGTLPLAGDVYLGVAFGVGQFGTLVLPPEPHVTVGTQYGSVEHAFNGSLVQPDPDEVRVGTQYGGDGTEFTGTYAAVCDYPVVGDVEFGVQYDFGILTGAFVVPDEGNVRYGIGYGDSGTEFTGTAGLILPPTPGLPPPTTPVFAERIAIAAVAKILTLPPQPVPIPSLVEFRKADKIHPGEAPCVIVTIGGELPAEGAGGFQLQGAGTPHDYGTVGKRYLIGISIYTESQGAMSTGTGEHPALVTRIKQAFDAPTLDGADSWWGCKIHQNIEWEQQFQNGAEVSRFVLEALSQEPRNG